MIKPLSNSGLGILTKHWLVSKLTNSRVSLQVQPFRSVRKWYHRPSQCLLQTVRRRVLAYDWWIRAISSSEAMIIIEETANVPHDWSAYFWCWAPLARCYSAKFNRIFDAEDFRPLFQMAPRLLEFNGLIMTWGCMPHRVELLRWHSAWTLAESSLPNIVQTVTPPV